MWEQPLGTSEHPSASAGAKVLASQASSLRDSPFSTASQQRAEDVFADHFARHDASLVIGEGARMFESARRDARLDPPVRHVLLQTLDRSLSRVCPPYRLGHAPLRKLAALDAWQATVQARVLDAIARCESGCVPVPLSATERVLESKQQALLRIVWPSHLAMLEELCGIDAEGWPMADVTGDANEAYRAPRWRAFFVQHLRRILFLTFDATLSACDVERLLAFVATPAGKACLATRAAMAPWQEVSPTWVPNPDPPEMVELQNVMYEMIGEAAGADPTERLAYQTELAERTAEGLHATF